MERMFESSKAFNQPIEKWDVSNVTDMNNMFFASTFNQPIEKWNVSNVIRMDNMFAYTKAFNQPIDKWDVSNVKNMQNIFMGSERFNQPLDNWDVSNVASSAYTAEGVRHPPWDYAKSTELYIMRNMFKDAKSWKQTIPDEWKKKWGSVPCCTFQ